MNTKETHADQALRVVGTISALAHDLARDVKTHRAGLPDGVEMEHGTITIEGVEPEVVDLIASPPPAIHAWRPKWGISARKGCIQRAAVTEIEGMLVRLFSKDVEGRIQTEAIRPDEES